MQKFISDVMAGKIDIPTNLKQISTFDRVSCFLGFHEPSNDTDTDLPYGHIKCGICGRTIYVGP